MKALGFLFLLLLAVGGVGYVLDWWSLSTETQAGETEVSFKIDKDKIGADTKAATAKIKEKTQALVDKVKSAGGDAATGTISSIDAAGLTVKLEDGSKAKFAIGPGTVIEVDDAAASPAQLAKGAAVTVLDEDGDGTAERIVAAAK